LLVEFQFSFNLHHYDPGSNPAAQTVAGELTPSPAAALAAVPDRVPVLAPFLAPAESAAAHGTDFAWQI
jgi:hypothetical protein